MSSTFFLKEVFLFKVVGDFDEVLLQSEKTSEAAFSVQVEDYRGG